jgi:D-glycero-beta-D-manno-heptose-7-phosphate kinase
MFDSKRILVVGDIMLDRYLMGSVHRISPEAPVPVLHLESVDERPGGAANVALNLRNLGMEVSICSLTGNDFAAEKLNTVLRNTNIDTAFMKKSEARKTTVKSRLMSRGQHLMRVDDESSIYLNQEETTDLLAAFEQAIAEFQPQAIILQDYNKGIFTKQVIAEILKIAGKNQIPIAVDPKFDSFFDFQGVFLFKPNLLEAERAMGTSTAGFTDYQLHQFAITLRSKLNCTYLIVTLSAQGILMAGKQGVYIIPAEPRSIADVCGAGDTVISTAMAALLSGFEPENAAFVANLAGGLVCEHPGVVPIQLDALKHEWNNLR